MSNFSELSQAGFFGPWREQLEKARLALLGTVDGLSCLSIPGKLEDGQKLYDSILLERGYLDDVVSNFRDPVDGLEWDESSISYIAEGDLLFIYSESPSRLVEALNYNLAIHGYIPVHRGTHSFDGVTIFTALYDIRLEFPANYLN